MASHPNPVERGAVTSLVQPGGNITGLTPMTPEMNQKRFELLKEAVPGLARVAVLSSSTLTWERDALETAARVLGVQLRFLEVRSPDDLDGAFAAAIREEFQAVITGQQVVFQHPPGAGCGAGAPAPPADDVRGDRVCRGGGPHDLWSEHCRALAPRRLLCG